MTSPAVPSAREFRDALEASDLSIVQRYIAEVFAKFAGDHPHEVFAEVDAIMRLTGAKRRTVYYAIHGRPERAATARSKPDAAIPGLIELGWLVQVRPRRKWFAPRYRLAIPQPMLPLEDPEPAAEPQDQLPGVSGDSGPNQPPHEPQPPQPARAEPEPTPAPACKAIRDELPAATRPDLPNLAREVRPLLVRGWTPEQLRHATRTRPGGWGNAGPGAVIAWLRGLEDPPPAAPPPPPPKPARAPWCGECDNASHRMVPSTRHAGKFVRCPRCNPPDVAPLFSGG